MRPPPPALVPRSGGRSSPGYRSCRGRRSVEEERDFIPKRGGGADFVPCCRGSFASSAAVRAPSHGGGRPPQRRAAPRRPSAGGSASSAFGKGSAGSPAAPRPPPPRLPPQGGCGGRRCRAGAERQGKRRGTGLGSGGFPSRRERAGWAGRGGRHRKGTAGQTEGWLICCLKRAEGDK